jgi:hypothetical protein
VSDFLPAWAWVLLEDYIDKRLENRGTAKPTPQETLVELAGIWPDLTCTLMVQMPWMGTIRFKRLARLRGEEMRPFFADPDGYIRERFGGGKFKVNLHHGLHFVNTKNFKPDGLPRWEAVPELAEE